MTVVIEGYEDEGETKEGEKINEKKKEKEGCNGKKGKEKIRERERREDA